MVIPSGRRARTVDSAIATFLASNPIFDNAAAALTYSAMMADATIAPCVQILIDAMLATPPIIAPANDTALARAAAEDLAADLATIDLDTALGAGADAIWRAFAACEIGWELRGRRFHLATVRPLDSDLVSMTLTPAGDLVALHYHNPAGHVADIPAAAAWLHRRRPSAAHPAGVSILDTALRSYKAKDSVLKWWSLMLQRYGMPYIIAQVPESTPQSTIDDLLDSLAQLQLDGVAVIPDQVAYQVISPTYAATITYAEAMHYHDSQLRQAIVLHLQSGSVVAASSGTSGAGLAQLAISTARAIRREARALLDSFNRQVLQPLHIANFGQRWQEICPTLQPAPGDAAELAALAAAWQLLVQSGLATADEGRAGVGLHGPAPEPPAVTQQPGSQNGGSNAGA